jgi:hypothetical protein
MKQYISDLIILFIMSECNPFLIQALDDHNHNFFVQKFVLGVSGFNRKQIELHELRKECKGIPPQATDEIKACKQKIEDARYWEDQYKKDMQLSLENLTKSQI